MPEIVGALFQWRRASRDRHGCPFGCTGGGGGGGGGMSCK